MVDNILSGEGFKTEGAVLTNKRLYYSHKKGIINVYTQDEKVDVKDITGSKVTNFNPLGILILSILALTVGGIFSILLEAPELMAASILPFLFLFLFLIYLFARKSHLRIEYAGGSIYFSVKKYKKENIRLFQKCIYIVKDNIDANK